MTFLWVEHLEERGQKGERWVLKEPETKFLNKHAHANVINSLCTLEIIYISLFSVITAQSHCRKIEDFIWRFYYRSKVWSVTSQAWHFLSEDNSNGIVPTAQVVSLLGDSSAFLKELSLWLRALFQHPWRFKKPHGSFRGTASQIPHVVTSWRWEWSLPAEITQDFHLTFHHLLLLKSHRILNHCVIFECTDDHIT